MRGIDHQLARLAALGRHRGKDLVEHAQPAPADELVVDRLVAAGSVRTPQRQNLERITVLAQSIQVLRMRKQATWGTSKSSLQ